MVGRIQWRGEQERRRLATLRAQAMVRLVEGDRGGQKPVEMAVKLLWILMAYDILVGAAPAGVQGRED